MASAKYICLPAGYQLEMMSASKLNSSWSKPIYYPAGYQLEMINLLDDGLHSLELKNALSGERKPQWNFLISNGEFYASADVSPTSCIGRRCGTIGHRQGSASIIVTSYINHNRQSLESTDLEEEKSDTCVQMYQPVEGAFFVLCYSDGFYISCMIQKLAKMAEQISGSFQLTKEQRVTLIQNKVEDSNRKLDASFASGVTASQI
ncbi:unnamed protein product [Darwinula stevensoni]|uniref:Uncharacterized protein n=1 Tax=Darwinula stevensoni TaxID=69355 RepID=A0A7R9AEJ8_9CRUS|nr:unnamed protein product [Darwinula stevensoni]CAG0902465.1 unnamed protein product [Darwinula stevensoni]